jgi:DNA-binding PadR family transcriptional regulator
MGRTSRSSPRDPLTLALLHILLALHRRDRRGYDIMQQVKEDSQGAAKVGLDRMIA